MDEPLHMASFNVQQLVLRLQTINRELESIRATINSLPAYPNAPEDITDPLIAQLTQLQRCCYPSNHPDNVWAAVRDWEAAMKLAATRQKAEAFHVK